ncbi:MAG: FtsX-like permease family protein [Actinobacteria bacterium]|nr:FtsX-like permease family protein [Actinomycetota bacterium]
MRHRFSVREAAIVGVVATIAAGVVLIGGLGGETLARVKRNVSTDWRPVYDLLVLPSGAHPSMDLGGTEVFESNFMAGLQGGITRKQWHEVLDVPGVEVAAPVATVGYMRRDLPLFDFLELPPGLYSVDRVVKWDNGYETRIQTASIDDGLKSRVGGRKLDYSPKTQIHLYPPLNDAGYRLSGDDYTVTGFRSQIAYKADDGTLIDYVEDEEAWDPLGIDPGGTFVVYGIDPTQEAKLTGLDALAQGHYLTGEGPYLPVGYLGDLRKGSEFCTTFKCKQAFKIPLLINTQGWTKTDFEITFRRWRLPPLLPGRLAELAGPCPKRLVEKLGSGTVCFPPNLRAMFREAGTEVVLTTKLPIDDSRFGGRMALKSGRWRRTGEFTPRQDFAWVARPSAIRYEPLDEFPTGPWVGAVRAIPSGSYGPEPTFREQLPTSEKKSFLEYNIFGRFDGSELAERFSGRGNWLPEDTYRPPREVLRFDNEGLPIDPVELRPTANPLGYLLEPPRALTTLRAAAQLLGEAPISAIRVRVGGVDDASEEAWTRIENVARQIQEATGLEPVVTLGSSPARVLVHVPGITKEEQTSGREAWSLPNFVSLAMTGGPQFHEPRPAHDAEGVGWVEEPWLTEGAAISYLRAGTAQHAWLIAVLAGAVLVYLMAAFTSLGLAEVHATAIRRAVGWRRKQVFLREMRRALKLGTIGAVAGAVAGTAGAQLFDFPVEGLLVVIGVVLGVALCCLSAIFPAWSAGGVPLAHVLAGGELAVGRARAQRSHGARLRIGQLALAEVLRMRTRALLALAAGIVATGSLMLIVGLRQQFGGSLQVTLLGQAILVDTGPLQTAVTVVASLLAVALLGEILWQNVMDRRTEIGVLRAIGWARSQVARLMLWQGFILGGGCALVGVLASGAVLLPVLGWETTGSLVSGGAPAAFGAGACLGLLAAGVPAYRASRQSPAGVLRSL